MREAVIVSTARTPIGKAYRGTLSDISGPQLAAHALSGALDRAGVTGEEIDDVVLGCAMQEGTTGSNVARQAALRAGLPVTVPGMTVDRQCGSGLMAIAIAAKQIIADGMAITVGGGVESISLVQNAHQNTYRGAVTIGDEAPVWLPPASGTATTTSSVSSRSDSAILLVCGW